MRTLSLTLLTLLLSASVVAAEQPHRVWLKYLAGSWKYDNGRGGGGEFEWKLVAGGNALIGTGKASNGIEDAWAFGWDARELSIVSDWFTAADQHARVSYRIVDDQTISGPAVVTEASGITKATVTVKRVSDNEYTVHWTNMTVNGTKADDLKLVVARK